MASHIAFAVREMNTYVHFSCFPFHLVENNRIHGVPQYSGFVLPPQLELSFVKVLTDAPPPAPRYVP